LLGLREAIMHAIPRDLRIAIGVGIGLFIAFIGLVNAGLVVTTPVVGEPLALGNLTKPEVIVAIIGLLATSVLIAMRIPGAILLGILIGTAVAVKLKVTSLTFHFTAPGFAAAFHADVIGAAKLQYVPLLMSVIMVDFFDTLGTATAIAEQAGLIDDAG